MVSSLTGELSYPLLVPLLTCDPPCLPTAHDTDGNTALHHAAAAGHTKALRTLLQFGASPVAQNAYSWTPVAYSATKQLELYFRELGTDFERKRAEGVAKEREIREAHEMKRRGVAGGVRLVTDLENFSSTSDENDEDADIRTLAGNNMGVAPAAYEDGMKTPTSAVSTKRDGGSWSPVDRWRLGGTPTRREPDDWTQTASAGGNRGRAWSGD
jgi:uncharacterized protein